jgi:hypothetical protein
VAVEINRRELIRLIAIVAILWVAALMLLSRWQGGDRGPELIHYPGTEDVPEQTSAAIGWRKYWFDLDEEYPSKSVFNFYRAELGSRGWQLLGGGEPKWTQRRVKGETYDVFYAVWVSPDRLFQIELQMKSAVAFVESGGRVVGEERAPAIQVYVTLRRALDPGVIMQPSAEESSAGVDTP